MRPNRVIEGSIHGFLRVLEHTLESEELARRDGLLQSLDPRVKLLGFLGLIVAAAASRRLEVIGAVFALASVWRFCSRVPLRTLMIRVWAGAFAFTGLIALPALFLTPGRPVGRLPLLGWVVTAQGLRGAIYLDFARRDNRDAIHVIGSLHALDTRAEGPAGAARSGRPGGDPRHDVSLYSAHDRDGRGDVRVAAQPDGRKARGEGRPGAWPLQRPECC